MKNFFSSEKHLPVYIYIYIYIYILLSLPRTVARFGDISMLFLNASSCL